MLMRMSKKAVLRLINQRSIQNIYITVCISNFASYQRVYVRVDIGVTFALASLQPMIAVLG